MQINTSNLMLIVNNITTLNGQHSHLYFKVFNLELKFHRSNADILNECNNSLYINEKLSICPTKNLVISSHHLVFLDVYRKSSRLELWWIFICIACNNFRISRVTMFTDISDKQRKMIQPSSS